MKSINKIIVALVAVVTLSLSANAQFRIGPRLGMNVNSLHFDENFFNSENRTGFTGGLQAEFTIPVIGIGLDASLMYVRRSNEFRDDDDVVVRHSDYFEIPINLKWKMNIPVIAKIFKPYVFTGPSFAFMTSKRAIDAAIKYKGVDTSWNVGLGLEFFSHLQIAAYYGFGINSAIETINSNVETHKLSGKTHCWTVTAAYLF